MAHTNLYPDFTDHVLNNGSILTSVKNTLIRTYRCIAGKCVLFGNSTTVNASVVQTAVSGLQFKVRAGKQYRITGTLLTTTGATPGIAVGMLLSGSSAATGAITYRYNAAAAVVVQKVTSNPLNSTSAGSAAAHLSVDIDGYFIPDVSGALNIAFAQNTSNASNTSVDVGSNIAVYRTRG